MDDDGANVEQIGHLNIACALHPVILTDGRIVYSTLESHGQHTSILWGIWSIHPDGTNWEPVVSAYWTGGAPPAFHFQTQLSDKSIVVEQYYNLNNVLDAPARRVGRQQCRRRILVGVYQVGHQDQVLVCGPRQRD